LRQRYDSYLEQHYSYDQVYTKASDVDRVIMTGQECLAGLYPGPSSDRDFSYTTLNWQPIPLRTIPRPLDNVTCGSKLTTRNRTLDLILFLTLADHPNQPNLPRENTGICKDKVRTKISKILEKT